MEKDLLIRIMDRTKTITKFPELMELLEVTTRAHIRIASLLRSQFELYGPKEEKVDEAYQALMQAVYAVRKKKGIDN